MPQVQFVFQVKGLRMTKPMITPKRAEHIGEWFKEARKAIPQIPDPQETDWYIIHQDVTLNWITFQMLDGVGQKAAVVIDRNFDQVGGMSRPEQHPVD